MFQFQCWPEALMHITPNSVRWSAFIMPVQFDFSGSGHIFISAASVILAVSRRKKKKTKTKPKTTLYKYYEILLRVKGKVLDNFFFPFKLLVNPCLTYWQGHQCCLHCFLQKFSLSFFQKSNFWGSLDSSVISLTPLNFSFCCQSADSSHSILMIMIDGKIYENCKKGIECYV